jgi:hypothetical protein
LLRKKPKRLSDLSKKRIDFCIKSSFHDKTRIPSITTTTTKTKPVMLLQELLQLYKEKTRAYLWDV